VQHNFAKIRGLLQKFRYDLSPNWRENWGKIAPLTLANVPHDSVQGAFLALDIDPESGVTFCSKIDFGVENFH
jgi:hypothetical protein